MIHPEGHNNFPRPKFTFLYSSMASPPAKAPATRLNGATTFPTPLPDPVAEGLAAAEVDIDP
jgi:hypothetical protein